MIRRMTCLLIIAGLLLAGNPSALAAEQPVLSLAVNPRPLYKTPINLTEYAVALRWYEDRTDARGTYHLVNPTTKKVKLTMGIPITPVMIELPVTAEKQPAPYEPALQVAVNGEEIEIRYSKSSRMYLWDLTLNAHEELDLILEYSLENPSTQEGYVATGFVYSPAKLWHEATDKGAITLEFCDVYPGQVVNMSPVSARFAGNILSFGAASPESIEDIIVTADLGGEKAQWSEKLSASEESSLIKYVIEQQYDQAASLLEQCWEKAAREDKEPLRVAQAYYLEKAGRINEAAAIFEELLDDNAKSPRVYWALGQEYKGQVSRLSKLYNQVKELRVHPLLQDWLAAQLPANRIKPAPPEIAEPDFIEDNKGLTFKGGAADPDGDLAEIILRYHWENEPEQIYAFDLAPFQYFQGTELTIPAPKPFQRLYYEVTARDRTGAVVKTGWKETFYLNSDIPVEVFPLGGATMIMGDFAPADQAKLHNWFKSYLKIAREVDFIPIEAKTPYFIFIGKSHDFIEQYQGPHFLHYTPSPFASEKTKIPVHRYFLSYWYGPGWNDLAENELVKLGDGLLLGRGFYTHSLKYLKDKAPNRFEAVLGAVGQGLGWDEAVRRLYGMSPAEIFLFSLWHGYGNNVLAVIIIIFLAWLGKSGRLVRFINYFRSN